MHHAFRFVLLVALGIVPIYFLEIDNKLAIMIGWIVGATVAYIVGNYLLMKMKKKDLNKREE